MSTPNSNFIYLFSLLGNILTDVNVIIIIITHFISASLDTAPGRLSLLAAHDAVILLKASFSAPKMMYTLRCSPCANHPSLAVFDDFLRTSICAICNLDVSDPQWLQASLPE